jgi:UDP-GlcNAc:undecaprenyl-phosphate GlcNAc-1-phosphate transferase
LNYILLFFCLVLFVTTYFAIKKFIEIAPSLSLLDIPNHRSAHHKVTPRGAGIVFGFIFIIGLMVFNFNEINEIKFTILALIIIYLCGVLDDIYTLSSKTKLVFIIGASTVLYISGYQVSTLGVFFGIDFHLGYLSFPFTVFAVVAFTNALNLSDGLDGLAGSLSVIILTALLAIGVMYDDSILIIWSSLLISIILAFLLLNWYPAKVFMGDSGSLLLGFAIAILTIKALDYINPASTLFLAAVPILDTLIVFRRRIQRGQSPFTADKNHLHHILNNIKQDKAFSVKMLLLIQLAFTAIFIQVHHQDNFINLLTFIFLFLVFFNLFDPRAKKRAKDARLKKKYQKEKKKKKSLKEKLGLMKKDKEGNI